MNLTEGQKDYSSQEFKGLVLKDAQLKSMEFESCVFSRCSFHDAAFEYCRFRDCTFQKCDLSFAHFKACTFVHTAFEDSQLIGINWTETAWTKSMLREPVNFVSCALNHSIFTGLSLRAVSIVKCVARDVDFSECDLTRANCTSTDFAESRFEHTNLTEADFTGATNYAISASHNTLKKTKFSLPEAMSLLHYLDIVLTEPS